MLQAEQIKRIAFLGLMLLVSASLLVFYPMYRSAREHAYRAAGDFTPPPSQAAPPPPPSPFPPGAVILDGALKGVADLTSREAVEKEPAYRKVVDHVATLSDAALEGLSEGEIAYSTYLHHAPELRGRVFRVSGIALGRIDPLRLPSPVAGHEDVYRLYLVDLDQTGGFVCDLVERPRQFQKGDRVRLEGMFLKLVRYPNLRNHDRDAPLLVARTVREIPPEPQAAEDKLFIFKLVLLSLIALVLLGAFFLLRAQGRSRARRAVFRKPAQP
jgi:hypothetical protein